MTLTLRPAEECTFDAVSLGEVMLRLDPGEGRIRTARSFVAASRRVGPAQHDRGLAVPELALFRGTPLSCNLTATATAQPLLGGEGAPRSG